MKDLPKDNGNNELKKSSSERDYVETNTTPTEDKKIWMKLSAWAALLSVVAALILLAIFLNQEKPEDNNTSLKQKHNISQENSVIKPKGNIGAGRGSATITDSKVNNTFPPKNLAIEPANPGGIYENHLAVSEEPLDWKAPMLKFMPLRLDLSPAKPTDKFWIRNDGRPDLTFTLSTNSSQISASPASGRLKTDQVIYITVTGTTDGIVIINSNGGYDNVKVKYQP